jgi:luciferase family oxidoreductase group 1
VGDPRTAAALRRQHNAETDEFPGQLLDLLGLLGDQRSNNGVFTHVRATPAPESYPPVVLLGSGDYSAELAGRLGLAFGFANHFNTGNNSIAHDVYRRHFVPSAALEEPYLIVTTIAVASDSAQHSLEMLGAHHLRKHGTRIGTDIGLLTAEDAHDHPHYGVAQEGGENSIVGTGDEVARGRVALAGRTGEDELMITAPASEQAHKLRSIELTAAAWGLAGPG